MTPAPSVARAQRQRIKRHGAGVRLRPNAGRRGSGFDHAIVAGFCRRPRSPEGIGISTSSPARRPQRSLSVAAAREQRGGRHALATTKRRRRLHVSLVPPHPLPPLPPQHRTPLPGHIQPLGRFEELVKARISQTTGVVNNGCVGRSPFLCYPRFISEAALRPFTRTPTTTISESDRS